MNPGGAGLAFWTGVTRAHALHSGLDDASKVLEDQVNACPLSRVPSPRAGLYSGQRLSLPIRPGGLLWNRVKPRGFPARVLVGSVSISVNAIFCNSHWIQHHRRLHE